MLLIQILVSINCVFTPRPNIINHSFALLTLNFGAVGAVVMATQRAPRISTTGHLAGTELNSSSVIHLRVYMLVFLSF